MDPGNYLNFGPENESVRETRAQTVHGFYTERSHERPYAAGNYLSKIETGADDVTGPIQGGGTYRITTDTDTELLLLGGLG